MKTELRIMKAEDAENSEVYEMLQEIPSVESGYENSAAGLTRDKYAAWVKYKINWSKGIGLPEGLVPETYYWFYVDDKIAGVGKIRHRLTESLRLHGGHIGYALRPRERGKGLGKVWLAMLMDKARSFGIKDLLITCEPKNIISRKVIEANGGVFESGDDETNRFWINYDPQDV